MLDKMQGEQHQLYRNPVLLNFGLRAARRQKRKGIRKPSPGLGPFRRPTAGAGRLDRRRMLHTRMEAK